MDVSVQEVYSKKAAQKIVYTDQSAGAGSLHCHSRSFLFFQPGFLRNPVLFACVFVCNR